jgi:hypothetical protein
MKTTPPIPIGATRRARALRWLTALAIPTNGECGLHKLTADELTRLAEAIQASVNREGQRAFDAANGR